MTGGDSPTWAFAVVGAGPAGAITAHQLARAGRDVALLERTRFPRYKVCGGCLNLRAISVLERCGLADAVQAAGARPLHRMVLAAHGRTATISLPGGWAISREAFDAALAQEAKRAGAQFIDGTRVSLGAVQDSARRLTLHRNDGAEEATAGMIVAADGLGQALLARAEGRAESVDPHARIGAGVVTRTGADAYETGTIYMACHRHGYVGLVRVEGDGLNLAAAFDASFVNDHGGLNNAAKTVLAESGLPPVELLAHESWKGTPPLTRTSHRRYSERVLVVGDAAGYIEPFTGEGMAWAMSAAYDAVPFLLDDQAESLSAWANYSARLHRGARVRCRALAAGLRRPLAVRTAIAALRVAPMLSQAIVRPLNAPFQPIRKDSR